MFVLRPQGPSTAAQWPLWLEQIHPYPTPQSPQGLQASPATATQLLQRSRWPPGHFSAPRAEQTQTREEGVCRGLAAELGGRRGGCLATLAPDATSHSHSGRRPTVHMHWNVNFTVCLSTPGAGHTVQVRSYRLLRMDGWPERDTAKGMRKKPLALKTPKWLPKEDLRRPQRSF